MVIAGPSGTGKTTLVKRLLARDPRLWFSVSANTRPPRPGEVEGRDYLFVSRGEFEARRAEGGFLESFEVYGDLKGTPRAPIDAHLAAGRDVLVEVDVQGALEIRRLVPDAFLVFVKPPSRVAQQSRLRARAEAEARAARQPLDAGALERRIARAEAEEEAADRFDAVVVNDDVDRAVGELASLLAARRDHDG
jgi:guanylate kinase